MSDSEEQLFWYQLINIIWGLNGKDISDKINISIRKKHLDLNAL
jgi:hypothetical protein